jgi:hypothetical protein
VFPITEAEPHDILDPAFTISPGGTHSQWNADNTENEDGSFSIITGGIRYEWPAATEEFDVADYDFVEVEYTATGVASSVVKQYTTGDDYIPVGAGNANLPASGFMLELRNATSGGFAIQKWGGTSAMTIKIDKLSFKKGTRYTIIFDVQGGTTIPNSYLVDGTKVGDHLPNAVKGPDDIFMGWKLGSTVITAATTVDSSFANATLTAVWRERQDLAAIPITFTSADELTAAGTSSVTLITGGYSFVYGGGYQDSWVKFTISLPEGTILADYDVITFSMEGKAGGFTYKDVVLLAGATLPASFSSDPSGGDYAVTNKVQYKGADGNPVKQDIELTIVKSKAASLSGDIEVCIYEHSGSGVTFEITDIVLKQND